MDTNTINRSELARAVGVDVAHISRIFSGKSNPSLDLASKIAQHLGITLDRLFSIIQATK
jgi:transcriptional regulator with XRE-family HTH domain